MFKIPKIEKATFYFDQVIKELDNYATKEREKISERFAKSGSTIKKLPDDIRLDKRKDLELQKIRFINDNSNKRIRKIIKSFPNMKNIDDIYIKLINTSETKVSEITDSLSRLLWIANSIDELTQSTEWKIKKSRSQETIGFLMKKYIGKANSYFRKNKDVFEKLNLASKFLNQLPKFENMFTVSIGGFPNVGKSTLLKKLTGSDVEIQNYPFTTKGLMFGYIEYKGVKSIQFIDTPGLLGRDKNNDIEERAQIVITDYSNIIVFVLDFTQNCGYSIEQQLKLLKKTQNTQKEILLYFSKKDIFNEECLELIEENKNKLKKFKHFESSEELKKFLIDKMLKVKPKFDPSKLKSI